MKPARLSPFGYDPQWVLEGVLAKSGAPGTTRVDVEAWIRRVRDEMGVKSVIVLLSDWEMSNYYGSEWPLELYRNAGLRVRHIPIEDPIATDRGILQLRAARSLIAEAFAELPKPVLMHCLAGEHRTGEGIGACVRDGGS